jgi:16S rRNA (guanine527-N7)-methyltransferase
MVTGHVLDSLSVRELLAGHRIVDAGTGAGFPGLPLAIAEPKLDITLVDSNGKKISFVRHMIGELGLINATAVQARIERYAPETRFDTVIARAFAPLPRLLALTGHLLDDTGVLLALKGKYPEAELKELERHAEPWEFKVTELTVPGLTQGSRHAIVLRRNAETRA